MRGGLEGCAGMASAGGDQVFDLGDGLNAAAGSGGAAVEGGGGAGEIQLTGERPALEQAVDEAGVEDVSSAGGIDHGYLVGGGVVELAAVPGEDALFAECGGSETAAVALLHAAQGGFEAGFLHETAGEIATDDEVVDVFEQSFNAGVELVEVGDDGDSGFAGPLRRDGGGGGVKAVDVQCAGVDDPVAVEIAGGEDEARVALAEDGAFAAGIDEDDGLGAGAFGDGDEAGLDAGAGEFAAMQAGGIVIAELADVAGAQAPLLAGYDGGCDLTAGEDGGGLVLDLGALLGVGREGDYGVGCIEPHADEVDEWGFGGLVHHLSIYTAAFVHCSANAPAGAALL